MCHRARRNGKRRSGKIMQGAAERWKPEAMYFAAPDGPRTALMVFDMADPSDLVPFCEPFFQELDADVGIIPVMAPDDLQRGPGRPG